MIACIARYHRKSAPLPTHFLYSSLSLESQILVQKLSALLRMANALDSSHKQKVKNIEIVMTKKQDVNLIVTVKENFILEKANFIEKKELFEEISGNKVILTVRN